MLVWHLPSPLGSPRSSRHSGNRKGSHLESRGLRNSPLSLVKSLHKLQERRRKKPATKSDSLKDSRVYQNVCTQLLYVGWCWYSKDIHLWYWPKVFDHLWPCQRGDVKFVRIPRIEDDHKDTWKQLLKRHPSAFTFFHMPSGFKPYWGMSHQEITREILPQHHLPTPKTAASKSVFPPLDAA